MRYYLYISDAKVDMLFPQVPGAIQQKVATKFGFDVKLISASVESTSDTFSSLVGRLHVVEEQIRETLNIGRPEEKSSWIAGTLDAKLVDIGNGAILFVARYRNTFVALGGSARHLIGNTSPAQANIPASYLPALADDLVMYSERRPDLLVFLPADDMKRSISDSVGQGFNGWVEVIWRAWKWSPTPTQRIEFLAKRLASGSNEGENECTLATPLYVALAE